MTIQIKLFSSIKNRYLCSMFLYIILKLKVQDINILYRLYMVLSNDVYLLYIIV